MIYGFGDSYTEGQPMDCTFPPFIQWKELRGGTLPKCWLEVLGEKMGMDIINFGRGGNSNQHIFDDVCNNAHKFNKGDIVIINWTYVTRFKWAVKEFYEDGTPVNKGDNGEALDHWRRYAINDFEGDFKFITKHTKDEILNNRLSKLYSEELYSYENLLEQYALSKGFQIYFWSTDNEVIYNLPDSKRLVKKYLLTEYMTPDMLILKKHHGGDLMTFIQNSGGQTIYDETNGIVNDFVHFGESGHRTQGELFFKHITQFNSKSV
jgi:hypothetical protein